MDGRLVPGHGGRGLPTFPFMASPAPERPGLCPAWPFALPAQLRSCRRASLAGVSLAPLAALAGQYYFWPIYIFPYVSEGGRIAPVKFYMCFLQTGSAVDVSKGPRTRLVSAQSHLPPPCTTPSPDTVSLRWGRHPSSHTFLLKTPQPTNTS